MNIKIAIQHNTYYDYERHIQLSPQTIRLKPAPHTRTPVTSYSLKISPANHFINWLQDPFGNYMARIVFPEKVNHFHVEVELHAELVHINPFDFFLDEYAENFPFQYDPQLKKELFPYFELEETGPLFEDLWQTSQKYVPNRVIDFLVHLNQEINRQLDYTVRLDPGVQKCEETLTKKLGSCRDFAWLLVQLLRKHGLAARFASGYLVQLKPDQEVLDGPNGPSEDFTDLHAWAEVFIPGAGWIGLDATSGLFASEGHIPLSCTPDPVSAAPITGLMEPCKVDFSYENKVFRMEEKPRVTKPYTEEQWASILDFGHAVDRILQASDVRLTMGGEPTFISAEDMEAEEWNSEADGTEKRMKGYYLALELFEAFAHRGFIHQGQGKWYPNEPIPRWQYVLYWDQKGHLLWENPTYFANPNDPGNYSAETAQQFSQQLAQNFGLSKDLAQPLYEDYYYFLWEKDQLPIDNDPLQPGKEASLAQKKLAEVMASGLDTAAGYVLPLEYNIDLQSWCSCYWETRRKHLYLIPGNSAIGYRLPLKSLSTTTFEKEHKVLSSTSPMADHDEVGQDKVPTVAKVISTPNAVKTALCVEIRQGHLYVFLPPLVEFDHFKYLLHIIEKTCQQTGVKMIIEGYQPPFHPDIIKLAVTPDPGVLEVNMQPASTWREIVNNYQILFHAAKKVKLSAEKFMLDGKHTGTGGGNHITLGGKQPYDSPLLRRPDLLRSMVAFWQNHPGLSYLFASSFIGPTSQAPRVDEGRKNILSELEIAFKELDKIDQPTPWIVDRIFRNLLIDITGNTHRAEFCIDKLYNPHSNSGRLGILELRGFDMPPNDQMCLVQILLIRALIARFWQEPYRHGLIDWGESLHDKFLLHYFVKQDMLEIVHYLNQGGIAFQAQWLDCFFEFRFPVLGKTIIQGIEISLRSAIEPWNVLGEEMTSAGTARYVDSSVEKVEILIKGIQKERYQLLCNRVVVPLHPTADPETFVVGVRYKAWNPPSALHPTIEADPPLTFDIYDTWNKCSIGGCVYHVVHPGGRNYDRLPINSMEAEGRRVTRFFNNTHTPANIVTGQQGKFKAQGPLRHIENRSGVFHELTPIVPTGFNNIGHTLDLRKVK